jgi:hypothetical protein
MEKYTACLLTRARLLLESRSMDKNSGRTYQVWVLGPCSNYKIFDEKRSRSMHLVRGCSASANACGRIRHGPTQSGQASPGHRHPPERFTGAGLYAATHKLPLVRGRPYDEQVPPCAPLLDFALDGISRRLGLAQVSYQVQHQCSGDDSYQLIRRWTGSTSIPHVIFLISRWIISNIILGCWA